MRSEPGGGKICVCGGGRTARGSARSARRTVAVEATILGRTRSSPIRARAQAVDARLVEAGDRAERPGDQVQLVLDDEVGRHRACAVASGCPAAGSAAP